MVSFTLFLRVLPPFSTERVVFLFENHKYEFLIKFIVHTKVSKLLIVMVET